MWILLSAAFAAPFERATCDIPVAPLGTVPAANVDACEAACTARADCGAFTFISGWNRCRLHAPTTKRITVHLVAAQRTAEGAMSPASRDHDHKGKDLEASPRDLPDAPACEAACTATATCRGYVYVEGYRSCWLKATDGELLPKVFTCGVRP